MHTEGHPGLPGAMGRRKFLKLGGAGLAGAALIVTVGAGGALAQSGATLDAEFGEAAEKYRVPKELLLAMGYVNTRWEMPPPEESAYEEDSLEGKGTYGIMALVRNPTSNTLGEAAKLTGLSTAKLKTDRKSNILGGAALLAKSQGEKPATLGEWFGAVDGEGGNGKLYEAVGGIGGGALFAEQVSETLRKGASTRIESGERVTLPAQDLSARTTEKGEVT